MNNVVNGWQQSKKLIPEFERLVQFLCAIEEYRHSNLIALNPKSQEALGLLIRAAHDMADLLKKDARVFSRGPSHDNG